MARLAILVIILEPIAQFWMNGNLAVDGIFLLQPDHLQDVSDATTFGEQLIRLQSYNLADPQASVDSESENRLIARVAQHTKYVGDFFRRKNFGFAWHMNKRYTEATFIHSTGAKIDLAE